MIDRFIEWLCKDKMSDGEYIALLCGVMIGTPLLFVFIRWNWGV